MFCEQTRQISRQEAVLMQKSHPPMIGTQDKHLFGDELLVRVVV
jgi:hypothetical protein